MVLTRQAHNNVGSGVGEGDANSMGRLGRDGVELWRADGKMEDDEIRGCWGEGRTRS